MSDLQTCLAVFTVAACTSAGDAKAMAINAIDAYVAAGPSDQTEAVRHLETLRNAYAELKLDSAVAITIAAAIERRISLFIVGVPAPDGALTDDSERRAIDPG